MPNLYIYIPLHFYFNHSNTVYCIVLKLADEIILISFQMMNKNEKAEVPENQKNFLFVECCFWFYHIAVIVILAFIMARVSMSYQEGQNILASNSYLHAQETVDLWGQGRKKCHIVGYIIDVKVVNTNNCPEGYSAVVNSTWNGTNTGCHCQTNVNARIFDFVLIVILLLFRGNAAAV